MTPKPEQQNKKDGFCSGFTKAKIEALTPILLGGMGFFLGLACILTGNNDPAYITLATGAITGACGVAASNAKDSDEIELEKYRYEQLGNSSIKNNDPYGGI